MMQTLRIDKLRALLESAMQDDLDDCRIGGASVIVAQEGQPVFTGRYGKSNTDTGDVMAPRTIFRLASMTKPVTAAAVLLQIQRGKLDLNDEVSRYIPSFASMMVGREERGLVVPDHPASEPIRLLHLLTHTSGILAADFVGTHQDIPPQAMQSLQSVVNYYGEHILLTNSPMELALYSPCAAFDVAARLVELSADMPYADFLRENLFEPLEMPDATFAPTDAQWARMAAMHNRTEEGRNAVVDMGPHTFANFPLSYTCGGASLCASIEDYAHFAEMLLCEGSFRGRTVLRPEMVAMMRAPRIPESVCGIGGGETWGLGVRVITGSPALPRGSFGWSGAYGTHFWVDPTNRLYAVYAKNSCYDGGSGAQTARRFEQCVMNALDVPL